MVFRWPPKELLRKLINDPILWKYFTIWQPFIKWYVTHPHRISEEYSEGREASPLNEGSHRADDQQEPLGTVLLQQLPVWHWLYILEGKGEFWDIFSIAFTRPGFARDILYFILVPHRHLSHLRRHCRSCKRSFVSPSTSRMISSHAVSSSPGTLNKYTQFIPQHGKEIHGNLFPFWL